MEKIKKPSNDILKKVQLINMFQYLNKKERDKIISLSEIIQFGEDEAIITEGETSPYLYAILEGDVCIEVKDDNGNNIKISEINAGDVVGEAAIFLNTARTATARSKEETIVLEIGRKKLISFIKNESNAGVKILLLIIYSMLNKLKTSSEQLALEKKAVIQNNEIEQVMKSYLEDTKLL